MHIVDAKIGVIGGTLPSSVGNAKSQWSERRGALLVLRDDQGHIGLGEASPLPGYSDESLEDCVAALKANTSLPPAAAFAMETALLDLEGQRAGVPIHRLLTDQPRTSVKRAGLVAEPWAASIDALRKRNIDTFKIKVGPATSIDALRSLFGTIRLDANGTWTREHLAACAGLGIEYVEQPLPVLANLKDSPVPWAADESLRFEADQLHDCVFVLKPAVLGGLRRCLELARNASSSVASHLFDGPVALAACCELALSLPGPALACGVDTHNALAAYPQVEIAQLRSPGVIVPTALPGLGFTREQREEIASWIS